MLQWGEGLERFISFEHACRFIFFPDRISMLTGDKVSRSVYHCEANISVFCIMNVTEEWDHVVVNALAPEPEQENSTSSYLKLIFLPEYSVTHITTEVVR